MFEVDSMSEEDSVEMFDSMTKWQIQTFYGNRCTFCLTKTTVEGSQCAPILDTSERASQVGMPHASGTMHHFDLRGLMTALCLIR
jgi:hypothetical protein